MEKRFPFGGWAKLCSLVLAPVLALTLGAAGVATAKTFKTNDVKGGYGCLANFEGLEGVGFQFVSDGKGKITSGRGAFNFDGEVCQFTIDSTGSSDTVNADGTGTLTIKASATLTDPDGDDSAVCTSELGGLSMNYAIVLESNDHRIDVSGRDPFLTGAFFIGSDPDNVFFSGACNRQTGS